MPLRHNNTCESCKEQFWSWFRPESMCNPCVRVLSRKRTIDQYLADTDAREAREEKVAEWDKKEDERKKEN